jgi:carboxymethylenebutenolidase
MCHNHSPAPGPNADLVRRRRTTIGSDPVPYEVVEPAANSGGPWIVLVTDIYGVNVFYRYLAEHLAAAGYRVATPDLFHRVGPARDDTRDAAIERRGRLDDQQALEDLGQVIDEAIVPGSDAGRPCFGAVGAAVSAAHPIDVAGRIAGPVLAFWGREDYIDEAEVDELERALDGAPGDAEIEWFEGAGHAFLGGLTEERADSEAARTAWARTLEFFSKQLPVES